MMVKVSETLEQLECVELVLRDTAAATALIIIVRMCTLLAPRQLQRLDLVGTNPAQQ